MKKKLNKFIEILEEYGENFFSCGNKKQDFEHIKRVIEYQGFYSGCRYRFYFDNNLNLLSIEGR